MKYEINWDKEERYSLGIISITLDRLQQVLELVIYNNSQKPETVVFETKNLDKLHYYEGYSGGSLRGGAFQLRVNYRNANNRKCKRVFSFPDMLEKDILDDLENFADENAIVFEREVHLNPFAFITIVIFIGYMVFCLWRKW